VTFRYKFQEKSECETGIKLIPANLHLPTEVEIITAPYCDSVRFFRNKKILAEQHAYAVEMHIIYNGHEVENPSEIVITNSVQENRFQSITLPVKNGLFLIPEKMANGSKLEIQARIGKDQIDIPRISPFALNQNWEIEFAEKRKFGEYGMFDVPKGWDVRSSCRIEFEPLDGDGMGMAVSNCRKPAS
jgi:hypothetical protein